MKEPKPKNSYKKTGKKPPGHWSQQQLLEYDKKAQAHTLKIKANGNKSN